jgi:hypothetical protein
MARRLASGGVAAAWLLAAAAVAGSSVAADAPAPPAVLVESVSTGDAGVAALDYLRQGSIVTLGAQDVLVLDYLAKCVRETITGGRITIGTDRSTVENGSVRRARLDCDGSDLQDAANRSEGLLPGYRVIVDRGALKLGSVSPVVRSAATGELLIERVDQAEQPIRLSMPTSLAGNPPHVVVDLAEAHVSLAKGGRYRATVGDRQIEFNIDAAAMGASAPLMLRVLPL